MKPRNRVQDHLKKTFKEQHPPTSAQRDLKLAARLFVEWKTQMKRCPPARQDLPLMVEQLKQRIAASVSDMDNIGETLKMLDDMKAHAEAALICQSNYIEEPPKKGRKPLRAAFRSRKEFETLPFIKAHMEAKLFDGFFLQNHYLFADMNGATPIMVGIVDNGIGIDHLPVADKHFLAQKIRDQINPTNN